MTEITPDLVRLMREASGMGMQDCLAAARSARDDFGGDYVLALLVRDAASLAVNVRQRDGTSPAEARRRWNVAHALERRERAASLSEAWKALDAASKRHLP